MTKAELIELLEPFHDDIRIMVAHSEYGLMDANLEYRNSKGGEEECVLMGDEREQIPSGEGYIVID